MINLYRYRRLGAEKDAALVTLTEQNNALLAEKIAAAGKRKSLESLCRTLQTQRGEILAENKALKKATEVVSEVVLPMEGTAGEEAGEEAREGTAGGKAAAAGGKEEEEKEVVTGGGAGGEGGAASGGEPRQPPLA